MSKNEVQRLQGSEPDSRPNAGVIIELVAQCPANAAEVLERVRLALVSVLSSNETEAIKLPHWIESKFAEPDAPCQDDDWRADDWIHYFHSQDRQWEWWSAKLISESMLLIHIASDGWPTGHGALDWLLIAAGATSVRERD